MNYIHPLATKQRLQRVDEVVKSIQKFNKDLAKNNIAFQVLISQTDLAEILHESKYLLSLYCKKNKELITEINQAAKVATVYISKNTKKSIRNLGGKLAGFFKNDTFVNELITFPFDNRRKYELILKKENLFDKLVRFQLYFENLDKELEKIEGIESSAISINKNPQRASKSKFKNYPLGKDVFYVGNKPLFSYYLSGCHFVWGTSNIDIRRIADESGISNPSAYYIEDVVDYLLEVEKKIELIPLFEKLKSNQVYL